MCRLRYSAVVAGPVCLLPGGEAGERAMRDENEISACGEAGERQPWLGLGEASVIGDGKISGHMMLAGPDEATGKSG